MLHERRVVSAVDELHLQRLGIEDADPGGDEHVRVIGLGKPVVRLEDRRREVRSLEHPGADHGLRLHHEHRGGNALAGSVGDEEELLAGRQGVEVVEVAADLLRRIHPGVDLVDRRIREHSRQRFDLDRLGVTQLFCATTGVVRDEFAKPRDEFEKACAEHCAKPQHHEHHDRDERHQRVAALLDFPDRHHRDHPMVLPRTLRYAETRLTEHDRLERRCQRIPFRDFGNQIHVEIGAGQRGHFAAAGGLAELGVSARHDLAGVAREHEITAFAESPAVGEVAESVIEILLDPLHVEADLNEAADLREGDAGVHAEPALLDRRLAEGLGVGPASVLQELDAEVPGAGASVTALHLPHVILPGGLLLVHRRRDDASRSVDGIELVDMITLQQLLQIAVGETLRRRIGRDNRVTDEIKAVLDREIEGLGEFRRAGIKQFDGVIAIGAVGQNPREDHHQREDRRRDDEDRQRPTRTDRAAQRIEHLSELEGEKPESAPSEHPHAAEQQEDEQQDEGHDEQFVRTVVGQPPAAIGHGDDNAEAAAVRMQRDLASVLRLLDLRLRPNAAETILLLQTGYIDISAAPDMRRPRDMPVIRGGSGGFEPSGTHTDLHDAGTVLPGDAGILTESAVGPLLHRLLHELETAVGDRRQEDGRLRIRRHIVSDVLPGYARDQDALVVADMDLVHAQNTGKRREGVGVGDDGRIGRDKLRERLRRGNDGTVVKFLDRRAIDEVLAEPPRHILRAEAHRLRIDLTDTPVVGALAENHERRDQQAGHGEQKRGSSRGRSHRSRLRIRGSGGLAGSADLDVELAELLFGDVVRRVHHEVLRLLVHREGDDLADVRRIGEKHHHTVDARSDAAVRRSAELKRVVEAAELLLDDFLRIAGDLERLLHDVDAVIADRARREFDAVADDVVLIGLDRERLLRGERLKAALRHRERVVGEDDLAGLRILLVEREVDDPAELVAVLLADVVGEVVRDIGADQTRKPVALVEIGRHEEDRVARLETGHLLHFLELLGREELRDRTLQLAFLGPADVAEALAAVLLDERLALVEPRARLDADDALDHHALDESARSRAGGERLEVRLREEVVHVEPLERIAEIRLVAAVGHHRVAVLDPRPRRLVAAPLRELLEGLADDVFDDGEDLVLRDIAHLDVELIELARATVGTRGLVAEARRDLEVLVEAGDLQQLLEHLRGLRQRVEHAAVDAARHEIVARAFRRGSREDRRLELVEALLPHLLTEELDHLAAENQVLVELLAAEIEEAVLETHVLRLVGLLVGDVDGRDLRSGLHHELVRLDFDLAGRQIGIDRIGRAELHLAGHRDDALKMRLLDETEEAARRMDDDLGESVMVAEVDEKDAAVVTQAEHPAGKSDGLARVTRAEFVTGMGTIRMHFAFFS